MVRQNFVLSVWLLIALCAVEAVLVLMRIDEIVETWAPFSTRVAMWPFVVGAIETMLWFKPFRGRQPGARVMAAFMGTVLLLMPGLTTLLIADMYDFPINWPRWFFLVYVALSHLLFALVGRPRRPSLLR